MTAEVIDLEIDRDTYPRKRDFPIRDVFMVLAGVHYQMMCIPPAQMIMQRDNKARGFPQLFALMEIDLIDIYPSPTGNIQLEIHYDDAEQARREQARQRWIWEDQRRRTFS